MSKEKIDFNRALTVGEVAKRSGVPISTLHFYEEKGLIKVLGALEISAVTRQWYSVMWQLLKQRRVQVFH